MLRGGSETRPICIKLRVGIGVPIWYDCCC
jgi:hypothetical protein